MELGQQWHVSGTWWHACGITWHDVARRGIVWHVSGMIECWHGVERMLAST